MSKIKGIDVSYHNGTINWAKVAEDGVKFAVIREGYRKVIDTQFLANVKGAIANKIPVMIYHFIYTDGATIKENASSTVSNMKKAGLNPATTYVWVDLEYDTWKKNGQKCTKTLCSKYTQEYIDALKALGCKKIGVYMNNDYYKNYYTSDIINNYPVWLADYSGDADHKCVIQQYSSSGKVSGINSNSVDMNYLLDESLIKTTTQTTTDTTTTGGKSMTEKQLRQSVVDFIMKYKGIAEGSAKHKELLAYFNNSGLCSRYKMTVNDAWCATTVSAVFIALGLAGKSGSGKLFECVECSCYYMIELAKKQGIWVESDSYKPTTGDVILYDWQDSGSGDNTGSPDHVGIVESCDGSTIKVIEGNKNDSVAERTIAVNGKYIRGFITPKYSNFASSGTTVTTPTQTTTQKTSSGKTLVATSASKFKISGTSSPNKLEKYVGKVTASTLNVRSWAGTSNPNIKSYPQLQKGNLVSICDAVLDSDKTTWFYVKIANKYYGFVSSKYIEIQ